MMPVSTKLTLLVLALPIFFIASVFVVGFYFYRASFDASAFSTAVSSLLSALLVILLVWERLRESLSKKLEYLHKNFLFRLFFHFGRDSSFWTQDEVKRLRFDLKRYGEFLNLDLYPKNLIGMIDEFLALHREFYGRLEGIEELAKKHGLVGSQFHRDLLCRYVGFEPDYVPDYTADVKKQYEQIAQNIMNESPQLLRDAHDFLQKSREFRKRISSELEDFLKSNNLRLEEEPNR